MTEAEWLACHKLTTRLMNWLRRKGSERRWYLAGCAAVRHVWAETTEPYCRELILLLEQYPDGQASKEKLARAHRHADAVLMDRWEALLEQGQTNHHAAKLIAGEFAAVYAAHPDGGWQASYSASSRRRASGSARTSGGGNVPYSATSLATPSAR